MKVNPYVFREYDIRGIAESDFSEEFAIRLAKAIGTHIYERTNSKRIVVGRDCRLSSPFLAKKIIEGLLSTGAEIIDIGIVPTPVFYFAGYHLNADGGVMITGSHNPPEFNGFKIVVSKKTIYGKEIQHLKEMIEQNVFTEGKGKLREENIIPIYIEEVKRRTKTGKKKIKVVIDPGNGTAGPVIEPIIKHLNCELVRLYFEPDGNFPNHFPDPAVQENLKDLINTVKDTKADLGIGLDGDADRIGVVDDEGNIIWGDVLLIIYAKDILKDNPNAKIIYEVKCTQALEDEIKKLGGHPIMWKTGHSLIEAKIHEEHALLAGEMSGHIYFADNYFGYDDAIYATARLINILQSAEEKLSEMIKKIPKYYSTPEIRTFCPDEIKFNVVENVRNYYKNLNYDIIDIDGVRVKFKNGWALLRASNTQPALVLRYEAISEEELEKIKTSFNEVLNKFIK